MHPQYNILLIKIYSISKEIHYGLVNCVKVYRASIEIRYNINMIKITRVLLYLRKCSSLLKKEILALYNTLVMLIVPLKRALLKSTII